MKGVYALTIKLDEDKSIRVGALGVIEFKKGFYVYTGSAMNNLERRIARHLSKEKKLHWHVDYLLKEGEVFLVKKLFTDERLECELSNQVRKRSSSSVKGFGCSDCSCKSHLHFFENLKLLGEAFNVTDFQFD